MPPEYDAVIELREQVAELRQQIVALRERFDWEEKARNQALAELERRLTNLNHAHENMAEDRTMFLRADVYDRFYQEYREWSQRIDSTLANQAGRVATWGVVLLIAIAVATVLATWLHK